MRILLLVLFASTALGCSGSMTSVVGETPFERGLDHKARCHDAGDRWLCRDTDTGDFCKTPRGDPCEEEDECPRCRCECFIPPGKK